MSYNQNYSTFRPNFTFHPNVPPPNFIHPPPFYITPIITPQTDQDFVKNFENKLSTSAAKKKLNISISETREKLRNMLILLEEIKSKEKYLSKNISTMSDDEWKKNMEYVEFKKDSMVKEYLPGINNMHLDLLRKLIAKRSAKRLRLKRVRLERKREKEDLIKKSEERSRKIDENLQKIKDDIDKMKQEEQAKLEADMVLKEVLRKKTDAKKCLVKLDALLKLRVARENTAKGRGQSVSEWEANVFKNNIEKLKTVWCQRLSSYEKEESKLREKLEQESSEQPTLASQQEARLVENLSKWKEFLFGADGVPQVDFSGDVGSFVGVRSKWDQFVSDEGSPLPVGWVLP
ncbi:uncharacterized protein LOC128676137 [Plodia interpunctella]|uniref:uncharacterized protein LOC128676137 n=1 Tax=Plodia interpunctella TaxID=58824 RepID=UPI0023679934|nr:uncharacterized protein LOC128676137 [Plodia interpunctella]